MVTNICVQGSLVFVTLDVFSFLFTPPLQKKEKKKIIIIGGVKRKEKIFFFFSLFVPPPRNNLQAHVKYSKTTGSESHPVTL